MQRMLPSTVNAEPCGTCAPSRRSLSAASLYGGAGRTLLGCACPPSPGTDGASSVGRGLTMGLAPLIHNLCCCQIKCSCPWLALWRPGRGEGPFWGLPLGWCVPCVPPSLCSPTSLKDGSTYVCSICVPVPSSHILQLSQLQRGTEGSEPWGTMHGLTAASLLLCWLWGGQLLTPAQEQETIRGGSSQLSPLSQHPTTHPSIAQLLFPQGLFVLGHSPRRHSRRAQSTWGGGGVHSTFIACFGPWGGGGPAAGAVVTAFDPLMWGRSSRRDSYSLPEEGKQGGVRHNSPQPKQAERSAWVAGGF